MLKVNNGMVEYEGTKLKLMAEFTSLLHELIEDGFTEEDIDSCITTAKQSEEELEKEIKNDLIEFINKLFPSS